MSRPLDPRLVRAVPVLRAFLAGLAGLQVIGAVLTVAQVGLLAAAIVSIFGPHPVSHALAVRLVALAGLGIARAAVTAVQEYVATTTSVRVRAELRRSTLQAIVRLGPGWVNQQPVGRLATATGPGLDALDGYVSRALPALVAAAVVPVVVLARIGLADWESGALLLVMLPLVPLFMFLVGVTTKRRVQHQYLMLSRLAGHFLDLLRGLTTLTIYGQAARQERTLQEATDQYRRRALDTLRIAFLSALVLDLVASLSVAVVAVDVGLRLDHGGVSFTVALIVLFLAPELFAPLRALGVNYHASEEGAIAAAAALDVIDEAADHPLDSTRAMVSTSGEVTLDNLTVHHAGRGEPAVDCVRLTLASGELLALGGESGAGKSTVLGALLGFVAPSSGAVLVGIDGAQQPLASLDAARWRANLAWVPQRPVPSQISIAAEVRLGDPTASDTAVADVCRSCRTPPPFTALGEDGHRVSAGQRRRIAVARALLRAQAVRGRGSVPIVLLDEPSEDLDRGTELVVAEVITSMAGWATVVIATHSPVLTALAQRRVTLEHGRIVGDRRQRPISAMSAAAEVVSSHAASPAGATIGPAQRRRRLGLSELLQGGRVGQRLAAACGFSAAAGLAGLGLTASSMWLISRAAQHPNVQALAIAVVGVRMFAIVRALLRYGERLSAHDAALRVLAGLRVRVFAALRPLGPFVLDDFGRGDLLRRFVGDVDGVQEGLVRAFVPLAGALATAAGAVALAVALAPAAGVALAATVIVSGAIVPGLTARAVGDCAPLANAAGRRDARSAALVEALPELLAYDAARRAIREINDLDDEVRWRTRRPARAAAGGVLVSATSAAIALPAVVWAAASAVRSGRLSVVEIGVLAACVLVAFDAVAPLPSAFAAWTRCRAGLIRVATVLDAAPLMPDPHIATEAPPGPIGLDAAAVSVAPARSVPPVLHDVDLHVAAGERVAVTGPSGCGKSTLLAAALRLIPIDSGALTVTGPDGEVALTQLRADAVPPLVAGSLQGDHVFDTTLRDNVRVVRPEALDDDLDAVAARAGLLGFVDSLPRRWSTPVGSDGALLSGGQRQRLLLARALLANPRVLVLDEPTAHLDAATERAIFADLLDATARRTVLLSTHRGLQTTEVDRVLRVDEPVGARTPGAQRPADRFA